LILGTFACSDGNNGQVTYPKPEGPAVGHWTRLADYPETAYADYSGKVIAGDEYISWGAQEVFAECVNGDCATGSVFNFVTNEWREMSLDGAPSARFTPRAAWTGSEVIFWAGETDLSFSVCLRDGGIYNPTTDQWRPMSTNGALSPRVGDSPIWTGEEVLFWGGCSCGVAETRRTLYNDGAAYNPKTDTWRTLSIDNAPSPRSNHAVVWTGTEMVIWGGESTGATSIDDMRALNDGFSYNPTTDSWRKLSSKEAPKGNYDMQFDWSGTELLLWGGVADETMAAYNPKTDSWRAINPAGPHFEGASCNAWTGRFWVICGTPDGGALYDPKADLWQPIPAEPANILSGMIGFPYNGDVIAMGGYGPSVFHGSDLELYRFVTPK
jgi:N-acetylneuraminic acid mutarotase